MARRPRLDLAGFRYIVNCGVARGDVYNSSIDKDNFLEILLNPDYAVEVCKDVQILCNRNFF